jgi:hypothetical protein
MPAGAGFTGATGGVHGGLAPGGHRGGAPGASGNLLADGDAGAGTALTANDEYATPFNDVFTRRGR